MNSPTEGNQMTDLRKVAQQALEALDCLEAPPTGAINHYELERRKNALRAALAQPDVPDGWVPPAGMKAAKVGYVRDGKLRTYTPMVVVHFEPASANLICDAKGWSDRDAFVAMLAAAPKGGA